MPQRTLFDRLSLRRLLTLPWAMLVLALALLMGVLFWRAGVETVDSLSGQLLAEAVNRVAGSVEHHIRGADAALEAAFPTGRPAPEVVPRELDVLRERLWLATSVHRDRNNYIYYGDRRGHFIGLWRYSEHEAELRLRSASAGPRTIYRVSGVGGPQRSPVTEDDVFDPRDRPWFRTALADPDSLGWTPLYVDFKLQDLVITRTKRVVNDVGEPEGVGATDLPLKQLNALLARPGLSENAVAMVVEADGHLVGVSRGAHLKALAPNNHDRLNALQSPDALVAASFTAVRQFDLDKAAGPGATPRTFSFEDKEGRTLQVGYARLDPALDLDWWVIVAAPRADFLAGVQRSLAQAVVLAGVATLAALGLGFAVHGIARRELRRLRDAARQAGDGALTDRSAILRHIEDRILRQRRRGDRWPFAIIRIDVDRFDHGTRDAVLKEAGQRLRDSVRIGDIVARYASQEFLLLLESVEHRADAEAAQRHLDAALRESLQNAAGADVRASFGLALYPDDGQNAEALLRHADADLYARRQGTDAEQP